MQKNLTTLVQRRYYNNVFAVGNLLEIDLLDLEHLCSASKRLCYRRPKSLDHFTT